ncbi:MAG: hypothetical protein IKR77_00575 [Bacteroidales bacterium]|nr:hypothetical protein [Bacteroidales bacterium]
MAVPWIYDFDLAGDSCLVSIQNQLLLYRLEEGNYKLMSVFQCENAKVCYLHRGDIYFMEEDHDVGYRWYRLHEGKRLFVRALDYEAPHVVQAKPNRYLFRDNHHVYFLSNRYPSLSLYSLEGVAQDTVVFDLPCWHPFEDEYVKASLEVPYGVERIKATMKDIYRYSYLKMVFPIGGDYLIYYTQYDTVTHESKLRFAIGTPEGQMTFLSQKPTDEYVYDDTLTPFTLLERHVDKAFVHGMTGWWRCCGWTLFPHMVRRTLPIGRRGKTVSGIRHHNLLSRSVRINMPSRYIGPHSTMFSLCRNRWLIFLQ